MNTPCLLSTGFSFFAFCIMALKISHYFLPGAFQKMFCHSSQQSYVHRELFHLVYTCWGFAQAFIFRNISREGCTAVNSDELRILIISHKACRIRDSHECSKNWFLYLCPARNKLMCVLMCIKSWGRSSPVSWQGLWNALNFRFSDFK